MVEEGLITERERDGLLRQVTQAASQKRASEVLTAAHSVHNKIIQVLRKGKTPEADRGPAEFEILYEVARLTQTCREREPLFERLLDLVQQAIPFEHATLFLVDRGSKKLSVVAQKGQVIDLIGGVEFDFGEGFSSWVAKQQKPVLLTELHRGRRTSGVTVGSFLSVPLSVQGELIGVLNLSHPRPKAFGEDDLRMLILVAGQAAAAIQRFLMYEEMSRLAITDELTGLCNRRHFSDQLRSEIDRARRYGTCFSLAMMDIDEFKVINDTHGHSLGDRVLADMGKLLRKCGRCSDLIARYGGEEFILLMPMTDSEHAEMAAERLRATIQDHTFPRRKKLTVSIGFASYPDNGTTPQEILRRADTALYEAKRSGRNCVRGSAAKVAAA
jgi:diguanylate cyclase (GGDEF)-like protein